MIVSTNFIPSGFGAFTVWPFIFVRPSQRGNAALLEHEMVHYREQAWLTPVWLLRYAFSKSFRLAAEVRAYKLQIALGGLTADQAAKLLTSYRLGISYQQALEFLA